MEEAKKFVADLLVKKWIKENKDFLDDYTKLCHQLLLFKVMWGVEIGFIFKNADEVKGRELGVGIVEELFDLQAKDNKKNK